MRVTVKLAFSASMTRYISTGSVRRRRRPRLFSKMPCPNVIRRFPYVTVPTLCVHRRRAPRDYRLLSVLWPPRPPAEQLLSNTDLRGNVRDRPAGVDHQTHRLVAVLRGVGRAFAFSRHGNNLPAGPAVPRSDVHHQGSTPEGTSSASAGSLTKLNLSGASPPSHWLMD